MDNELEKDQNVGAVDKESILFREEMLLIAFAVIMAGIIIVINLLNRPPEYKAVVAVSDASESVVPAMASPISETESVVRSTLPTTSKQGLININTADVSELQKLSGIGPSKAAAIIEYRQLNGPFSSIDELINVKGIGEATLKKIKDQVCVK